MGAENMGCELCKGRGGGMLVGTVGYEVSKSFGGGLGMGVGTVE